MNSAPDRARPSGTVTFLFTDIEGSTRLWSADRAAMASSLALHDEIVRSAIESHGGYVFSTGGDGCAAAFAKPSDAVEAASAAQRGLDHASWPGPALRVRMGLHLGEAEERDGDYFGPAVNIAARVESAGHGGQVLLTEAVRDVAAVRATDLGVHCLRDVAMPLRIYQLGAREFPALRVVDPGLSNLPVRPTRIIGRDDEVSQVRQLLAEHRLVTISAVGGSGKTRLAIAVGEAELPHRPGGVWFVDLTAVMNDLEVAACIAKALGLSLHGGDSCEQVVDYLSDKSALVILDNCEHVVEGCADFADRFLAVAGSAVVLATSREALSVEGERTVMLPSLRTDGEGAPAVRLFTDRAAAVDPSFQLTVSNADLISTLCARLDGMPLAIELAAARVSVLTPAELLEGLSDRFALLSGGRRRQRQRTLEATLDWSYDLLGSEEQRVLRALGVFVDGFDIDAVAAVTGLTRVATLAVLEALVAKSLVVHVGRGERSRFTLLETVKAYAEDRLVDAGEASQVRDAHLVYFHLRATERGCAGFSELRLGIALRPDRGNLTAAFEWAAAEKKWVDACELITAGYAAFLLDGGGLEAADLIRRAIDACELEEPELTNAAQIALCHCLVWFNDWSTIGRLSERLMGSSAPMMAAFGFLVRALVTIFTDPVLAGRQLVEAESIVDEAVRHEDSLRARILAGYVPWFHSRVSATVGDYEGAFRGARLWLAVQKETDFYSTGAARATKHAAACQLLLGDAAGALATVEWLDQFDFVGATADDIRALSYLALGDLKKAEDHIRVHAARAITGRLVGEACDSAWLLAALAHAQGEDEVARALLLEMGLGQEPATIVYSSRLAEELGISDEHRERQRLALAYDTTSAEGPSGSRKAMAAVRGELARRGWA